MATSRLFVVASSFQVNDNFQQLLMNTSRNEKHVNQLLLNGKMDVMMGICLPIIDHKSGKVNKINIHSTASQISHNLFYMTIITHVH